MDGVQVLRLLVIEAQLLLNCQVLKCGRQLHYLLMYRRRGVPRIVFLPKRLGSNRNKRLQATSMRTLTEVLRAPRSPAPFWRGVSDTGSNDPDDLGYAGQNINTTAVP